MFKRILVPLDGSPRAECVLPVALRLARVTNGTIVLLRVVNTNWPSQTAFAQRLPATAKFEAEKYLHELVKSGRLPQVSIETIVIFGVEAPTILSTIATHQIDLVIFCGHDYSTMNRWVVGSVVDKVTRRAEVPVLLLHYDDTIPAGLQLDFSQSLRILVPLDGSVHAEAALNPAAQLIAALASPLSGTLHVMSVINPGNMLEDREHVLQANAYLQQTIERMRKSDLAPVVAQYKIATTWSVVIDADIPHAIIRTAEQVGPLGGYDIIAIATHDLVGLSRWMAGSTTDSVHYHSRQPLLIVQLT